MDENVINKIYIDGEFVTPHGTELADLFNPATGYIEPRYSNGVFPAGYDHLRAIPVKGAPA